jgi:hypothetical protein
MIERQIDRPIPIPSAFLVKSGSNIRSISFAPIPVLGIRHRYLDAVGVNIRFHRQDPQLILGRHGLDGVCDQVQKHLLQLDSIAADRRQLLIRLGPGQYPMLLQVAAYQGKSFPR